LIHIGNDVTKPIFIDNKTTVVFTGMGQFIVDNSGIPAFVLANSDNVTLTNWNILYTGALPLSITGVNAGLFNDTTLKSWLVANRGITFSSMNPKWPGPTDLTFIFFLRGSTSNISVTGMKAYVSASTGADKFIPGLFGLAVGEKNNTTITSTTPINTTYFSIPNHLTFNDIDIDGYYMGWQGNLSDTIFNHIRAHRYGDLQDATGGTIGGVNHWSAPPHLLYLNFDPNGDIGLVNKNITITDTIDYGDRLGLARDPGPTQTLGSLQSLKIGGINILVDGYESYRPDGFADILATNGMTIRNVKATYNSAFLNYTYPAIRFPGPTGTTMPGFIDLSMYNINIADLATSTNYPAISSNNWSGNTGLLDLHNIAITLNKWTGTLSTLTQTARNYAAANLNVDIAYTFLDSTTNLKTTLNSRKVGSKFWYITAAPSTLAVGANSTLTWGELSATTCTTNDTWSNTTPLGGSKTVTSSVAGVVNYSYICTGSDGLAHTATVSVTYDTSSGIPTPTVSLTASPTSITSGGSSTLSWSSTNATSCTGSGFTASGTSGTVSVSPTATQTYSITCTGTGGSVNASVTVNVSALPVPTTTLTASPTSIISSQSSMLAWSSTDATSCIGTGFTPSGTSGTVSVSPTATQTYSITCTGAGGSASASVTVTVTTSGGSSITLTPAMSPTVTYDTVGQKFGTAALSGSYAYTNTFPTWGNPGTIQAWFKQSTIPTQNERIVSFDNGTTETNLIIQSSSCLLIGSYASNGVNKALLNTTSLCDGNWHLLELDLSSAGAKLFVDGVLQSSRTEVPDTDVGPYFGLGVRARVLNGSCTYTSSDCEIDEVSIWNTALHTGNYTVPSVPWTGTESGLVAVFHLDGDFTMAIGNNASQLASAASSMSLKSLSDMLTSLLGILQKFLQR
jgi:hypothetical protein